ncbi:MAG: hypothetical protein JJ975_01225 [Bacteroidia bacterium]|nr:hypothetical protein [Bacteroidia bacterium]
MKTKLILSLSVVLAVFGTACIDDIPELGSEGHKITVRFNGDFENTTDVYSIVNGTDTLRFEHLINKKELTVYDSDVDNSLDVDQREELVFHVIGAENDVMIEEEFVLMIDEFGCLSEPSKKDRKLINLD